MYLKGLIFELFPAERIHVYGSACVCVCGDGGGGGGVLVWISCDSCISPHVNKQLYLRRGKFRNKAAWVTFR